jgi:hypothetical protein
VKVLVALWKEIFCILVWKLRKQELSPEAVRQLIPIPGKTLCIDVLKRSMVYRARLFEQARYIIDVLMYSMVYCMCPLWQARYTTNVLTYPRVYRMCPFLASVIHYSFLLAGAIHYQCLENSDGVSRYTIDVFKAMDSFSSMNTCMPRPLLLGGFADFFLRDTSTPSLLGHTAASGAIQGSFPKLASLLQAVGAALRDNNHTSWM